MVLSAWLGCTRIGLALWLGFSLSVGCWARDALWRDAVTLPSPGQTDLRLLTPQLLELRWVQRQTSWETPPQPPTWWEENPSLFGLPPSPNAWQVTVNGQPYAVSAVGWKRFPVLADPDRFDLLLEGRLYLRLAS